VAYWAQAWPTGQALLSITEPQPYQTVVMFINDIWPYANAGCRAVPVAD